MPQTYRIKISYDGTDYYGWQRQPRAKTIQGTLEAALFSITSQHLPVVGAGRTDAGVHALGQTAHFIADCRLSDQEFLRALNGHLPGDIRISALSRAPSSFHARKAAKSKVYQYRIVNSPVISPFLVRYALHWPGHLDIQNMKDTSALFVREADFSAFSSNRFLNPVRSITRSEIRKRGKEIIYTVQANGFLRYMVRSIVGTLLEAGRKTINPEEIEDLFVRRKRSLSSPTAPARGLCLVRVVY